MTKARATAGFDIYIVGLGMVGIQQITVEADAALRRAEELFLLHYDSLVNELLAEKYAAKLTDVMPFYEVGLDRSITYQRIAETVLVAGAEHAPVAFASYGHPFVFVSPTRLILNEAPSRGLSVKVLPGISALDGLLIDLRLDPARHGLQMYEATDLLLRRRPLQPDVPCLIWQIGAVETLAYRDTRLDSSKYEGLRDYLLDYYDDAHRVVIARTPTLAFSKPRLIEIRLSDLPSAANRIDSPDTLFIPEAGHRPTLDPDLLERIAVPKDAVV